MKTIDASITSALGSPRSVNVRYTAVDTLLKFDVDEVPDSLGLSYSALVDAATYSTGVLRAVNSSGTLYIQEITDLGAEPYPSWTNTGIALKANSLPGVEGGTIWFQASDGNIKSAEYTGSLGTPTTRSSAFTAYTVSCAPVSTSECFVHYLDGTWGAIARIKVGSSVEYWSGRVYGAITSTRYFDAATLNGKAYLYYTDDDNGRLVELVYSSGMWSQSEYVIPLDIVDDVSFYRLSRVSVIDNKIFLTARLSRPNDADTVSFDAYLIGPRPFSMGKEMFITADNVSGKLFLDGNTVYYLGVNKVLDAPATQTVGVDNAALKTTSTDIVGIGLKHSSNSPLQCRGEIPVSASHAALAIGKDFIVEAGYNGVFSQIARTSITNIEKPSDAGMSTQMLSLIGLGTGKMVSWVPDMNFDLVGHGYISDAPNELTSVIRARGVWEVSSSSLVMDYRNTIGVLYSASRPSRGGLTKVKFYNPAGTSDWKPEYGVGVNYRQEAKYEAAERLGVELSDVNKSQYGDNGIVAIYGPTQHSSASGVGLYSWVDSELTLLTSAALSIPDDTWHWLSIYFVDGYIRVMYRTDASTSWTEVLTHTYASSDLPWKKDYRGHGFVYLENKTTSANAYNFRSDSMIIGVDSVANLPASGVVEIDSEQITYSAKTGTTGLESGAELDFMPDVYFYNDDASSFTGYPIVLDTAGSLADKDLYDGYALVVTSGPGAGRVFEVSDYDYETPQFWIPTGSYTPPDTWQDHIGEGGYGSWSDSDMRRVFVTENPSGTLGPGSKVRVVPSLTVSERGSNGTNATTHSAGVIGVFENLSVKIDWFENYDSEMANRIEDIIKKVAAYSGVTDVTFEKRIPSSQTMPGSTWNLSDVSSDAKKCIPIFTIPTLSSGNEVGAVFRMPYKPYSLELQGGDAVTFEDESFGNLGLTGSKVYITYRAGLVGNYGMAVATPDTSQRYASFDLGSYVSEVDTSFYFNGDDYNFGSNLVRIHAGANRYSIDIQNSTIYLKYTNNSGTYIVINTAPLPSGTHKWDLRYRAGAGDGFLKLYIDDVETIAGTGLTNDTRTVRWLIWGSTVTISTPGTGQLYFDDIRYSYGGPDGGYMTTLYYDGADYYLRFRISDGSSFALLEEIKLWFTPSGEMRVAVIDDHFSVWIDGLYITTFRDGTWSEGDVAGFARYGSGSMDVDFSVVDQPVESFILDSKSNGYSAVMEMLSGRNIYLSDDQQGSLNVFKTLSDVGTLADIVYGWTPVTTEIQSASRVRGEGLNVVEVADYQLMRDIGNLFSLFNTKIAEDIVETQRAVSKEITDRKSYSNQATFDTAADWRLEPGDIVTFQLPGGNEKYILLEVTTNVGAGSGISISQIMKARRHPDELT